MGNGLQGFSIQADFFPISNLEIERAVIKKYRSKLIYHALQATLASRLPVWPAMGPALAEGARTTSAWDSI